MPYRLLRRITLLLIVLSLVPKSLAVLAIQPVIEGYSDSETRVIRAYLAYYGRPPDLDGLQYWSQRLEQEKGDLSSIILAFGESPEFYDRFGHLSSKELIANIYQQLFSREPDPEGESYYARELDSGRMHLGDIAIHILDGARNTDLEIIENKSAAAGYLVDEVRKADLEFPLDASAMASLLEQIDGSASSLNLWYRSIDDLVAGWGSNSLASFSSEQELADYLKKGLSNNTALDNFYPQEVFTTPVAEDAGLRTETDPLFSTTNIQESGVDEADRVKTDGRHLYIASEAEQPVFFAPQGQVFPVETGSFIRVLEMIDSPPSSREIARMDLDYLRNKVDGLYLLTDRELEQPDLLVTLGATSRSSFWASWASPWYWGNGSTEVAVFDVDDPADPLHLASIELEGHLVASRRIEETLYLVTRYTPSPPGYTSYPLAEQEEQRNQEIIEGMTLDELLPHYSVDRVDQGSLVSYARCFLPPTNPERIAQPTLVSVTAIDLGDPDSLLSSSIVGPTEAVYVAPESLYLATTRNDYILPIDAPVLDIATSFPKQTDLHKFSLAESNPTYLGSGTVIGHLGSENGKKPFRMGEHEGVLRIATSVGDDWNGTASTRLTLLQEEAADSGTVLKEISHLDNIGKPGERLYASRFIGDRAYLVTFRVTDPLYVFDLSDPTRIETLAEIEVAGYSDYLYPVGNDLLLGIGKDAVPDPSSSDFGGRGAWYQGVKVSLFDVSGAGSEINSLTLGKRGTESDALHDHHALTLLPSGEDGKLRLALPIDLHDTRTHTGIPEPWTHYSWTHTGLYLFEVTTVSGEQGIENTGQIIVADDTSIPDYYRHLGNDRSVLSGNSVHYIHRNRVWSSQWDEPTGVRGPE